MCVVMAWPLCAVHLRRWVAISIDAATVRGTMRVATFPPPDPRGVRRAEERARRLSPEWRADPGQDPRRRGRP